MKRLLLAVLLVATLAAPVSAYVLAGVLSSYQTLPPPSAPTNVTATPGDTQNTITWTNGTGATSHDLLWGTTPGGETNTIPGVTSPYTHTGLTGSQPYYYKVRALNSAGQADSSESTATPSSFNTFTDSFTAANGSSLASAVWATPRFNGTYSSGGFNIQNNQAKFAQTSTSDVNQVAVTVGNSTVSGTTRTIQVDLTQTGKNADGNVTLFVIAASSYPMASAVAATPNHIRLSLDGDLMYTAAKVGTSAPVYAGVSGTTAGYLNWSGQLKIVLTPTQVSFYIDGVQVGSTYTHGIDFSGGVRAGFQFGTTGSNASLTSNVFTADNFTVN